MLDEVIEVIKTIGGIASCLMSIAALFALGYKPIREKFVTSKKERDAQRECDKCLLRNEITNFYYANKKEHTIAEKQFENIDRLYQAYRMLGGNSFIVKIYTEIKEDWDIKDE